jgi:hypothetical protein
MEDIYEMRNSNMRSGSRALALTAAAALILAAFAL